MRPAGVVPHFNSQLVAIPSQPMIETRPRQHNDGGPTNHPLGCVAVVFMNAQAWSTLEHLQYVSGAKHQDLPLIGPSIRTKQTHKIKSIGLVYEYVKEKNFASQATY
jgi:hypothetical protein